jgi:hypothetical protein
LKIWLNRFAYPREGCSRMNYILLQQLEAVVLDLRIAEKFNDAIVVLKAIDEIKSLSEEIEGLYEDAAGEDI